MASVRIGTVETKEIAPPMAVAASKEDMEPPKVVAASEEELDPLQFVSAGQSIIHVGIVWKLNSGADMESKDSWLKRKMWLTSCGGLFYFSRSHDRPLGRTITGLTVKRLTEQKCGRHTFEVIQDTGAAGIVPTVLATPTSQEREVWIKHIHGFQSDEKEELAFSENLFGRVRTDRHGKAGPAARLGSQFVSKSGSGADLAGRDSDAAPPVSSSGGYADFPCAPLAPMKSVGPSIFTQAPPEAQLHTGSGDTEDDTEPRELRSATAVRRDSQLAFAEKMNTTLILDYDDTIFPTTWIRGDCGLSSRKSLASQVEDPSRRELIEGLLAKLHDRLVTLFDEAEEVANIVVVTLAKRPWVTVSAQTFMPKLANLIEDRGIRVIYAQEFVTPEMRRDYSMQEFQSSDDVSKFWTKAKAKAISAALSENYGSYGASWKNIISFGDSDFERYALIAAGEDYMRKELEAGEVVSTGSTACGVSKGGHLKKLRTKTVKMLAEPTVHELIAEATLLGMWMKCIVKKEHGFDLEIENSDDDERLSELHEFMTGDENCELSWPVLAGMTRSE
eukprot:TRINITY_DN2358_c0_g1_i2.p1 TRINITY_DN2358_c0_g1~~TRINITY_DN2358_c0_g1_i2.p1  ORF type:complete len:574 (+),score=114.14 TRINITY_DN2358_c0_g1_i2:40-1722(+)